jgi:hypothetical protein
VIRGGSSLFIVVRLVLVDFKRLSFVMLRGFFSFISFLLRRYDKSRLGTFHLAYLLVDFFLGLSHYLFSLLKYSLLLQLKCLLALL